MIGGIPVKVTVLGCAIGVLGFGEDNNLVDGVTFPKDAATVAERLEELEAGRLIEELEELIERLRGKGYTTFIFERTETAQVVQEKLGVDVRVESLTEAGEVLRGNMGKLAVKLGFLESEDELAGWIHKVSMELTRRRVRRATEKRDLVVVHTIQMIDDIEKTINLFMNRVREWYGLHFPELNRLVEKHETYARLVNKIGRRENFTPENLVREGIPEERTSRIAEAAVRSVGAELQDVDIEKIRMLCGEVLKLYRVKSTLEDYLRELMDEVAPNISALAGATLGARLIALAGGLDDLAKMPASTIQILGAEKALFRSLKTGSRPPKHGVIFQHSLIHGSKRWLRGKIARLLAGKLAIAARTDSFSGKFIGDRLREDLERRVKEIKEKYLKPKPKPAVRARRRLARRRK